MLRTWCRVATDLIVLLLKRKGCSSQRCLCFRGSGVQLSEHKAQEIGHDGLRGD